MIDSATKRAIIFNEDGATKPFYDKLKAHKFETTQCCDCKHIAYPPRLFCGKCGCQEVDWIEMPKEGKLYAFSQQTRSLRFSAPSVLGLIEFPDMGLVFTLIDAKLEDLKINQKMALGFHKISDDITVHKFKPA